MYIKKRGTSALVADFLSRWRMFCLMLNEISAFIHSFRSFFKVKSRTPPGPHADGRLRAPPP